MEENILEIETGRPRGVQSRQVRWRGLGETEERLSLLLRDFSQRIDRVWEEVGVGERIDNLFDTETYREVAPKIPHLSVKAQEVALRLVSSQDKEEQEEGMKILLHTHLRTILGVVDRFSRLGPQKEELLERGILAAINAIGGFQPGSVSLSQRIHQEVTSSSQEALAEYLDVPPTWLREGYLQKISTWMGEFHHQNGRLPTAEEIAQHFDIRKKEVKYQLEEGFLALWQPSNLPITTLSEEQAFRPAELAYTCETIEAVLQTLGPREQTVIRMHFGLGYSKKYTLEEIAEEFGVKRERIRQIEARALREMRHPLRAKYLKDLY